MRTYQLADAEAELRAVLDDGADPDRIGRVGVVVDQLSGWHPARPFGRPQRFSRVALLDGDAVKLTVDVPEGRPIPVVDLLMARLPDLAERFTREVLADQTAIYWRRRADTFEAAAPQPSDYVGNATKDELEARRVRCLETAAACRHRAELAAIVDTPREYPT